MPDYTCRHWVVLNSIRPMSQSACYVRFPFKTCWACAHSCSEMWQFNSDVQSPD